MSPAGVPTLLYSGGNPDPIRGVYGPGHCSVLDTDAGQLLCFHFRTAPDAARLFGTLPLRCGADDRPYCLGESTDWRGRLSRWPPV